MNAVLRATVSLSLLGFIPVMGARFWVVGSDGSWPAVLTAVGHQRATNFSEAGLIVVRENTDLTIPWRKLVEEGRTIVIEGANNLLPTFGFERSGAERVWRESDTRAPETMIVWESPVLVPAVRPPFGATVFTRDRWTSTPLVAGLRMGQGGVLYVAADPGPNGYERFPYLIQSLVAVGVTPPADAKRILAFFDYSYRSRTEPEYMARRWRQQGIAALHVSSWYFFEPDPSRDAYLRQLIQACHRNGILVHAWLELPHVSQRFWDENPQCREKNILLQDAAIYWRKNMNLLNPVCHGKVEAVVRRLLTEYDWDGVNLAELYFEGPRGLDDLSEFTPLNPDVRREFAEIYGYDPLTLFDERSPRYFRRDPVSIQQFFQYRRDLQYRLHVRWLDVLASIRSAKPGFDITICYLEDLLDPRMRDLIGADARRILQLQEVYDFHFQIQDPSSMWGEGPSRYARAAEMYRAVAPRFERMSVDINIVARPSISFPTLHQTGTEFFQLVNISQRSFPEVMLYFEFSILRPDTPLLGAAHALANVRRGHADSGLTVDSEYGAGVAWTGPALVDGQPWPYQDATHVWLTPGRHTITHRKSAPPLRLLDFNGSLRMVKELRGSETRDPIRGLSLIYSGRSRAIAIVERRPAAIWIDGAESQPVILPRRDGSVAVMLPPGEHWVSFAAPDPPGNN